MKKIFGMSILVLSLAACSRQHQPAVSVYEQYLPQAQKIYAQMTLDQKIGQLLQPSYVFLADSVSANGHTCIKLLKPNASDAQLGKACGLDQIATYHLGSVLSDGGPYFNSPTLPNWQKLNRLAETIHQQNSPYDPVLLIGNDAVHGNMHVEGAVLFPHNIGLGATHDPALIQQVAYLTGQDSLASGFNWIFAPVVGIAEDIRWGRTYETFGQDAVLVKALSAAYVTGAQDIQNGQLQGVLATAKHFIGDGATEYGLDEGDDHYQGSFSQFWQKNGAGYEGAVAADAGSLMVSFSAIKDDNARMHFGGSWNILNQFKGAGITGSDGKVYQFMAIAVSDWNGATRAAYFYDQANDVVLTLPQIYAKSFNAGVDIFMLGQGDRVNPFDQKSLANFTTVEQVFNALKTAYQTGLISDQRLQDAVTRILAVKLAMAKSTAIYYKVLQLKERQVALQAAQESLVLLKNDSKTLPLHKADIRNVVFVGPANDLGLQNGGWSVSWQGQTGNQFFLGDNKQSSGATTLVEGVKALLHGHNVHYYYVINNHKGLPEHLNPRNTIVIALVAELPYAEYMGDISNPNQADAWYKSGVADGTNPNFGLPQKASLELQFIPVQAKTVSSLHQAGLKVITVVYSGRPVILTEGEGGPWPLSNAVIAAFLPGTLGGEALANAMFGDYHFKSAANGKSNTLTFPWPRDMTDVENQFSQGTMFDTGYGLAD